VPELIDPRIARLVGHRFTGDSSLGDSYLMERLRRDLSEAVPRSEDLVEEASGIARPAPVRWGIVDRSAWVDANIAGMSALLEPITKKVAARLETMPTAVRIAQRTALSTEVGVLLGYISRRVLGQYDVLVSDAAREARPGFRRRRGGPPEGTSLYFVGQNIVETERRLGFAPQDFALWVSIHEVTHRFQFAGVPWLKDRFLGLVETYLGSLQLDARGLASRMAAAGRRLMSSSVPPEEKSPVYLLSSEPQRKLLDELQALMAVVEGHGNYVMDAVGREIIPSFARMRRVFDARRQQTTTLQKIFNQIIGLEMKLRQYELGQSFCESVAEREGPRALERLWADPSMLPSLSELKEPQLWLRRVA
jgi:coenzyme F420 biosynthesis associated uncharacterized protein